MRMCLQVSKITYPAVIGHCQIGGCRIIFAVHSPQNFNAMRMMYWPGDMITPMSRWMETLFSDEDEKSLPAPERTRMPSVNVLESPELYTLEVAGPGYEKEDFQISTEKGMLSIRAEKKTSEEEKKENYLRREFGYSRFERRFALPEDVKEDGITADFKNGILTIRLPRHAEKHVDSTRKIKIG